jgi:WD40 repeat protein
MAAPTLVKVIKLDTQTGTSYTLDWSQDGNTLAAGSGYEITLLDKDLSGTPMILKPETGALGMSWNADGNQLATINGYRNPDITIWDLDTAGLLTQVHQFDGGADQYGVSWSPDGKLLATLADDDKTTIQIWDTGTWDQLHVYDLPYAYPRRALNWSADSKTLYDAGEAKGQAVVFALEAGSGTVREIAQLPPGQVSMLAMSPDAKIFAVADERGTVQFIDVESGETLTAIKTVDQPVDLAWNPDGKTLAILAYKTSLQLWEIGP